MWRQGVVFFALATGPTSAQVLDGFGGTPYCLPPVRPMLPTSGEIIREFTKELGAEFNEYFDRAQAYLRCLAAAQEATYRDVQAAIDDYNRMIRDHPL